MSAKDPRRALMLPLPRPWRRALRALARGGSLADQVRRIAQADLPKACDLCIAPQGTPLPLQLPRQLRADLTALATAWNRDDIYVLTQILAARLTPPLASGGAMADKGADGKEGD